MTSLSLYVTLHEFQVKESDEQRKLEMESKKSIKDSRKSNKNLVSGRTASSKTSPRLQELQMKERARLAELEIEREFIEKQRQGEIKLEELKVQCQIEKTRARMKVFEEESNKAVGEVLIAIIKNVRSLFAFNTSFFL